MFAATWRKTLTTLHGRLDLPDLPPLLREFPMMPLVSISDAQRAPVPWANWCGTVHHGLPPTSIRSAAEPAAISLFSAASAPKKGPKRAIEIARRAGMPLIIAAKVDKVDHDYYKTEIEPLLNDPLIEFIGEVGDDEKGALLGDAMALLFPIDWPEPFGLVMIEAMACGTPVIAFRRGAVPEIMEPGVTGFIVDSVDEAARGNSRGASARPQRMIRQRASRRFQVERMARDYVALYGNILRCAAPIEPATAADAGAEDAG